MISVPVESDRLSAENKLYVTHIRPKFPSWQISRFQKTTKWTDPSTGAYTEAHLINIDLNGVSGNAFAWDGVVHVPYVDPSDGGALRMVRHIRITEDLRLKSLNAEVFSKKTNQFKTIDDDDLIVRFSKRLMPQGRFAAVKIESPLLQLDGRAVPGNTQPQPAAEPNALEKRIATLEELLRQTLENQTKSTITPEKRAIVETMLKQETAKETPRKVLKAKSKKRRRRASILTNPWKKGK